VEQNKFDIELFHRIKRNDRLALNTLFAHYYQKLCTFAYSYLRDREEVEEVVSDVFFNFWQKRHQLKIEKNLKAYLYICVKHRAFAVIKLRQPHVENIDDVFVDDLVEKSTPEHALIFKELEGHFEWAIDKLPPRCKQVFLLKWQEALSYRDIGIILDISEKTVENQLVNAMCKIKESLRFYQIDEVYDFPA